MSGDEVAFRRYDGRLAAMQSDGQLTGYLLFEVQEWTSSEGILRRHSRRSENLGWRLLPALPGDLPDEGVYLNDEELAELDLGVFRYKGTEYRLKWLAGVEAENIRVQFD